MAQAANKIKSKKAMKLKLLHTQTVSTFYNTYFNAKETRPGVCPILRFDVPHRHIERRFYMGALDNKEYAYCNVTLKRLL